MPSTLVTLSSGPSRLSGDERGRGCGCVVLYDDDTRDLVHDDRRHGAKEYIQRTSSASGREWDQACGRPEAVERLTQELHSPDIPDFQRRQC